MSIKTKVIEAALSNDLATLAWPGSGDLTIALQTSMLREADAAWRQMPDTERSGVIANVRRAIKRTTKRIKQGRSTQADRDALASDVALWAAYERLFGVGTETYERTPIDPGIIVKALSN